MILPENGVNTNICILIHRLWRKRQIPVDRGTKSPALHSYITLVAQGPMPTTTEPDKKGFWMEEVETMAMRHIKMTVFTS